MDPLVIADKLLPSNEADPRSVRNYRLRTALVACSSFMLVVAIVLPSMFIGLPKVGQVAWSDEVDDKIKVGVDEASRPIYAELGAIKAEQSVQGEALRSIQLDIITQKLRELHALRCRTTDAHGREQLEAEIEVAQRRFRTITGDRYPLLPCKDL